LVSALGKDTLRLRLVTFTLGSTFASIAGSLLIVYLTAFNPSVWDPHVTFVVWTALLVGGRGNHIGVVLGVLLVVVVFTEGTTYLPEVPGHPGLIESLRFVVIGLLIMVTLWARPRGLLPEKRRFYEIPIRAR
jgi:ABC-type branched-subunit amino acid transport system permease subunit